MNPLVKLKDAIAAKLEVVTASRAATAAKSKLAQLERDIATSQEKAEAGKFSNAKILEVRAKSLEKEVESLQPVAASPVVEAPKAAVTPPAPAAKSTPTAPPRTAASFRKNIPAAVAPPSAAVPPLTPRATIVPAQFATKPDFSAFQGVERVTASMKWNTERDAYFLAEATKQIEAEEAAARPPSPFAGLPATAENLAKSLLYEQAQAAKPKVSAWSQAGSDRTKAIKTRAAELKKSASL